MKKSTFGRFFQVLGGALIAFGAVGHSLMAGSKIGNELSGLGLAVERVATFTVVWHFAGMCMVLLGLLIVAAVWRKGMRLASGLIAVSYLVFGAIAFAWSHQQFFLVFSALGLMVILGLWLSNED